MSNIEATVNDLSKSEFVFALDDICDGLSQTFQESKEIIMQTLQTIKAKIASFSASNPQHLQKTVDIELNSSEGQVEGSKMEASIVSGENFECPFGQHQEDLKESMIYFSIVFNGKDEESAMKLNEKITSILLPAIFSHDHFKHYENQFKRITSRRIGSKVYLVLSKDMPETIKDLAITAAELFHVNQDGVSISNILKIATAFKLNDLMHLSMPDVISKFFKMNIDFKSNLKNIDYFIDFFINLFEQEMKNDVYGNQYVNNDLIEVIMVLQVIKMINSIHTNVNLSEIGKLILMKECEGKYEESVKMMEHEKKETLEDIKEFRDKLIGWGLKDYMDLIDFDRLEIHIVHPAMMLGLNVIVDIPGLGQLIG